MTTTPQCQCEDTCTRLQQCPYVDDPQWLVECEDRYAPGVWERVDACYTERAALDLLAMEAANPGEDWTAVRARDGGADVVLAVVNLGTLQFVQELLGDLS